MLDGNPVQLLKRRSLTMRILSVNVSLPKIVEYKGDKVETGIFKERTSGSTAARTGPSAVCLTSETT